MTETAEERRAHAAALSAVEIVEVDTLRRLSSAVLAATKAGTGRGDTDKATQDRRRRIEAAVALALIGGRRDAREASADSIAAEVNAASAAADLRAAAAAWDAPGWAVDATDAAQARQTASAYADLWASRADALRGDGLSADAAGRRAAIETRYRLATDAITEVAQAAELEAERQLRSLPHHLAVQLMRVWDATRDRKTCGVCAGLDGTRVPATRPFPGGLRPGFVHPRCRCRTSIHRA